MPILFTIDHLGRDAPVSETETPRRGTGSFARSYEARTLMARLDVAFLALTDDSRSSVFALLLGGTRYGRSEFVESDPQAILAHTKVRRVRLEADRITATAPINVLELSLGNRCAGHKAA